MTEDLISRQAAIDAHCELCPDRGSCSDICPDVEVFKLLPSVQPEQISRDIATILENEHDMRIMLKNAEIQEQRWIPVTERLPEDDTEVVVSIHDDAGDTSFNYTTVGWHFKGEWIVNDERNYYVSAWIPLPEPYREVEP